LFHGLMLAVASAAALNMALPDAPEPPQVLRGELDPVDNRAAKPSEGGGSPGELGGERLAAALTALAPTEPGSTPPVKPPAEALLSEILPTSDARLTEAVQQALPGPQTSGFGPASGAGAGGGGGSGGGIGGGAGHGIGPGTTFFGASEHAGSFAYVIDCSGSMATKDSLNVAKRELIASLDRLPPDARFGVIFYNLQPTFLTDPQGRRELMAANVANKSRVYQQLARVAPDGGTDHMAALRAGLSLQPEVIFFLTDADLMTGGDAAAIAVEAGTTRIQAIEFGRGAELGGPNNPLRRLAAATGGSYRYVDVTQFPRLR
jgi:hypothetical protein